MSKRKRDYKAEYKRRKYLRSLREEGLAAAPKTRVKLKKKRKRDYKKEYKRRKISELKVIVARDAKRVFGFRPKRQGGEGGDLDVAMKGLESYAERLETIKKRDISVFDWTDEQQFITSLTRKGVPIQEAYTMWFSP